MGDNYLKQTSRNLKFWGILAPVMLIALCVIIAAREGVEASWNDNTVPTILWIALFIFVAMRTVAYALDYIARSTDRADILPAMGDNYLKQSSRNLKFWGILAPVMLIALCVIIAAREGVEASWNDNTVPMILWIALIIFVAMRTVAYALDYIARPTDRADDS